MRTFLFRGPSGRIHKTEGETLAQAANQLGRVLSWDDDNTVCVLVAGKPSNFTFTDHGVAI